MSPSPLYEYSLILNSCWDAEWEVFIFVFRILPIYLRERKRAGGAADGQGETDALLSKEPEVRLKPRTLGT